jgi:hypothetical protein
VERNNNCFVTSNENLLLSAQGAMTPKSIVPSAAGVICVRCTQSQFRVQNSEACHATTGMRALRTCVDRQGANLIVASQDDTPPSWPIVDPMAGHNIIRRKI